MQALSLGVHIAEVVLLSSEANWRCDMLSRGQPLSAVSEKDETLRSVKGLTVLDVSNILRYSNPSQPLPVHDAEWLAALSNLPLFSV